MTKSLAIGIATFNRAEYLRLTIQDILKQRCLNLKEIIIVDQTQDQQIVNSQRSYFSELHPSIRYMTMGEPQVCRARNIIINNSVSDIILFLDDDVLLGNRCLDAHIESYNNPLVASATGHIYHRKPTVNILSLSLVEPSIGTDNHMHGQVELIEDYRGPAITCNQSFLRAVLHQVRGFDENFLGGYYEDADLGLRVIKNGYKIIFNPDAMVLHLKAPMGGLRFTGVQAFTEKERLVSYCLFFIRYPFQFGFFTTLYAILRVGPFRKQNLLSIKKHFISWGNLLKAFYFSFKTRHTISSSIN